MEKMKNSLTLNSPTQQLIAEFRHAVMLNLVKPMPCIKGVRLSELRLRKPLARAHVLDFGFLLNARHPGAISSKAQWEVNEASRDRGFAGLLLPFPQTVFLFRNSPHSGYPPGVTGFIQVLVLLEHVHGIAAHHFYRVLGDIRDDWGWAGSVLFDRDEENLKFLGFNLLHIGEEATWRVLVNLVWTSLGLLNVKFDGEPVVVEVRDQAPRQPNAKMNRAVQPSIGVVHVNKPLVIRTRREGPVRGRKMPGHDRRQHERTYRKSGKTITVPASKVNGGAKTSAFKRVNLGRPL
jgi:hypothetical protein